MVWQTQQLFKAEQAAASASFVFVRERHVFLERRVLGSPSNVYG